MHFEMVGSRSPEAFIEACRAAGLRIGRKRRAVARAIVESEHAFDSETLLTGARRLEPGMSHGTIYLSLRAFCRAGLIRTLENLAPIEA
jgi:Fe2+ or Zn2+ uptake regulation protein